MMDIKLYTLTVALMLSACAKGTPGQPPIADAQQEAKTENQLAIEAYAKDLGISVQDVEAQMVAESERQAKVDQIRQSDPNLNWIGIGISTGKFSEDLGVQIYKTHSECVASMQMSDNACAPIGALPDSYWNAENVKLPTTSTKSGGGS